MGKETIKLGKGGGHGASTDGQRQWHE